jgi:hypothetical protein
MEESREGFEVKGLGWPGRQAGYDSNSRAPSGLHRGLTIFYVFGRYPSKVAQDRYPLIDLVVCHGDFLNADHTYVHVNKSFGGFGSYGDLLVRDRKMYVAPTPFALVAGTSHQRTLILPARFLEQDDSRLKQVGMLRRIEADQLVVGYTFDLLRGEIQPQLSPNPYAGQRRDFVAYRSATSSSDLPVELVSAGRVRKDQS